MLADLALASVHRRLLVARQDSEARLLTLVDAEDPQVARVSRTHERDCTC